MLLKLEIYKVCKASREEWSTIWQECDYATYSHSPDWAEVWSNYSNKEISIDSRLIIFSDGKKAVIPLLCQKLHCFGLIKKNISSLKGSYGGWISKDNLSVEHSKLLVDYMLKKCGNLFWRINPYDKNIFAAGINRDNEVTLAVNLKLGFDTILERFSKANFRAVHKAKKCGITVTTASTIQDWQSYFKVYENSLERWGENISPQYKYTWELFNEINSRNAINAQLWLAIYDKKIVAGALCFYAKKHVVYWHGCALKDYFEYRPVNMLMYEIIKDACRQDYSWFDFNPSGGLRGVRAFKESFGSEAISCPEVHIETKTLKVYNKMTNRLRNLVRKLARIK